MSKYLDEIGLQKLWEKIDGKFLPSSSISSWAKATTKPSYAFSEIKSTPTTLSGYGITDAYTKSVLDAIIAELHSEVDSIATRDSFLEVIAEHVSVDTLAADYITANTIEGNISGNATTATAFASAQSIALTGDVTGSASSTGGWSIATTIGTGKVTNAMLAGSIANGKLANSSMTIAGTSVSLGGSISAATIGNALTTSAPAAYATKSGSCTGNAGSATQLATARSLWGNSFDGAQDISGKLEGVTKIEFGNVEPNTGGYLDFHYGNSTSDYTSRIIERASGIIQAVCNFEVTGNVGVGVVSPTQKLHVDGNILATGNVTAYSDMRLKDVVDDSKLSISDFADAPLFDFKWKDGADSQVHTGTSAQYWQDKGNVVTEQKDEIGTLALDYATLGVAGAIVNARKVRELENKIKELEKQLKERV